MKSLIPVVMAGILGIYGMIVAVILSQRSNPSFIQSRTPLITRSALGSRIWHRALFVGSVAWYG